MQEFQTIDDVLRFAIAMEVLAHQFYTELILRTPDPAMQDVFQTLADEELIHKEKIEALQEGIAADLGILEFSEMEIKTYAATYDLPKDMNYKDAIELATRKEKDAFLLYSLLADSVTEPDVRELFEYLAKQEKNHEMTFKKEYDRICLSEN